MDITRNIMTTVDYKRLERCIADGRVDVADYLIQSGERKPNGDTEPSPTVWSALNKGNVQMIDLFVRNNVWRPSGAILMDALFTSGNMELFDALDRFTPNWRAEINWHIIMDTVIFDDEYDYNRAQMMRMKNILQRLLKEIPTREAPVCRYTQDHKPIWDGEEDGTADPLYQAILSCLITSDQSALTRCIVEHLIELGVRVTDAHLTLIAKGDCRNGGTFVLKLFNEMGHLAPRACA